MPLQWYAARTKSRAEYTAADSLRRAGYEVFSPHVATEHPRPGHADAPLFPGYLFLRCDLERQGWPLLRQVPKVLGLVRLGGAVPPVPAEVIADLEQRVQRINTTGGLWSRFLPGQRVRVVHGAVESLGEVIEEATSPQKRVQVLLEFMGRLVKAQVPRQNLLPAPADVLPWNQNRRALRRTRGKGRWLRGFGPEPGMTASSGPPGPSNERPSS